MSRIIVTCRSVLAISQSLVCLTAAVPAYQMHRCRETKVSGVSNRYEADVSGYLLPLADNYSYVTASARQCKFIRFSLLLYSKQERSLFTAALEQTSNVPTARDVGRLSGRIRRRACGLLYPGAGRRSHPLSRSQHVFQHVCHGAGDLATARRLSSGVRRGRGAAAIPQPVILGSMAVRFPSRAPLYPPRPFCDVLGAPPSSMSIVRRLRWGPDTGAGTV